MSLAVLNTKERTLSSQESLYREAVSNGAFTVSSSGAKKVDVIKFLSTEEGLSRMQEILRGMKTTR